MLLSFVFRVVRWFLWSRFAVDYQEGFFPQEEAMSAWVSFLPVQVSLTDFLPWDESIATIGINSRWGFLTLECRKGEYRPRPFSMRFLKYRRS
ncbi:MAG: hypothetical protein KC421_23450 [Anaerolineales bacterium]|nr:hypothetical protein [Anaerolineales bacterium]